MLLDGALPVPRWVYCIHRANPWLFAAGAVGIGLAQRARLVFQPILVVAGLRGRRIGHGLLLG
ncbi:hypothetical protein D3C72_2515130 [compost metagenome]